MKKLIFVFFLLFLKDNLIAQYSNFLWAKSMGGSGYDFGESIAVDNDGNVVTTGLFQFTCDFDPSDGVFNLTSNSNNSNTRDIFLSKLDRFGNFLWARQIGGINDEIVSTIKINNNGDIYLTGSFKNICDFNPGPEVFNLVSNGRDDVFVCKLDASGNFLWAKQINAASSSMSLDKLGFIYLTGSFQYTCDFDPGSGVFNLVSKGLDDIYICKLDASGNFLWAKSMGGQGNEQGKSITVDIDGNVLTSGEFNSKCDFDPGPNVFELNAPSELGPRTDIFISKLDNWGNFIWAKKLGGLGADEGPSIGVDRYGNIYTTGTFIDSADFDPGPFIYNLVSGMSSRETVFISKLNSLGDFVWAKKLSDPLNEDGANDLIVDSDGNIIITGQFGPRAWNPYIFISKLNNDGNVLWQREIGPAYYGKSSICLDKLENIYVTGDFINKINFDPGTSIHNLTSMGLSDAFVMKLEFDPFFVQPKIDCSNSFLNFGETQTITGKGFTPNGTIFLNFFGSGGRYNKNVTANSQGAFTYLYSIPANAKSGFVSVVGFDSVTAKYSLPEKKFELQLTPPNTGTTYLNVSSPKSNDQFSVGQDIHVDWSDKLQRNFGSFYYPMDGTTSNRFYKYRIEYQTGAGAVWQLATTIEGKAPINTTFNHSQVIHINSPDNNCKVRIVDGHLPTIIKTTGVFSVGTSVSTNLKAELIWDKSFPTPSRLPQGVAADGVSRLYVKVTKKNPAIGTALKIVNITAQDGVSSSTEILGKLKEATAINIYSNEANDANTFAISSAVSQNENFWFWYIAPDDFSEKENSSFRLSAERTVTLHIMAQYADNSYESYDLPVKIVRPPLVMAHGLASSEAAWQQFHYVENNSDIPFEISPLFKIKTAINLYPSYAYNVNALQLLSPNASGSTTISNRLNSLQGNIDELRQLGYACNQVDYVCHSMGGCVLRTAMTVYGNKFYGNGGYINEPYKTYGKGFVHKVITINTPHTNTPVADAVTEFIPQASWNVNQALKTWYGLRDEPFYKDFITPDKNTLLTSTWKSTDAVKDLQVSNEAGGKDLAAVTVKNHLISGDVDLYSDATAEKLAGLEPYLNILDKVLDIMTKITLPPAKNYLKSLQKINSIARVLPFIEWYSQQKGFSNFLGDGDVIVPLKSQLAGLEETAPNVSVFPNTGFLNSFHNLILDRADVGNRVLSLLNTSTANPLFGNVIPATKPNGSFKSIKKLPVTLNTVTDSVGNKNKVEIVNPLRGALLFADTTLNIHYKVKDTVRLSYVEINFQTQSHKSFSFVANQSLSLQVNPSLTGEQLILVTAVYENDTSSQSYTDTLTVNVQTVSPLLKFKVSPQSANITKGIPYFPTYTATHEKYIASVPYYSPELSFSIADSTAIKYDTTQQAFIGMSDTSSTYAVISYRGFTDTIYFINTAPLYTNCVNITVASGNWNNPAIWQKGVVPGNCDSVVISSGHNVNVDVTTQINGLNILNGAALSINDSLVILKVGETDDGMKNVLNSGSLNLNKGKLSVNGRLQFNPGSTFNMTAGEIVIDGNTGYSATSVINGKHLFDVSDGLGSFSFTGGTLQITDPPLGNSSQAIKCNYNFGDSSILKLGDGVSTTFSNNPNGFGGNLLPAQIGRLIFDAATKENNRIFINLNPLTVKSPLQVLSGNLVQGALLKVIN